MVGTLVGTLVDSELMGSRLVSKPVGGVVARGKLVKVGKPGGKLVDVGKLIGKVVVAELLDDGLLDGEGTLVVVEPIEELLGTADEEIEPLVIEVENEEEFAAMV